MPQADFVYVPANDPGGLRPAVSIFADHAHVRDELCEDVNAAGLPLRTCGAIAALLEGEQHPLGELVLLDCPAADAQAIAALSQLDACAARAGAHLIVSTSVAALDDVFACCDQSGAQILVDPTRAERIIALGRVLAKVPNLRLRELSQDDRMALLRLTEQVTQIAQRLERLSTQVGITGDDRAFRFESPAPAYGGPPEDEGERLVRARSAASRRPPLPDPRLVRRIIRHRQLRARFFDPELFADPAWDILLDLTAARAEHARVSITSACLASGVPPTTALRWVGQMIEAGLLERVQDDVDRRRAFVALSDRTADAMARYFAELGRSVTALV